MPYVTVLIPHHRNPKHLGPLFTSILDMDMDNKAVQYILVDNGSTDGSVEFMQKHFPHIEIFRMVRNMGFAPALNHAVRSYESDWICFLNNDMRVDLDWLPNLLYAAEKENAVCFSSHILDWNGKQTQFAGGYINWFGKGFENQQIKDQESREIFFPCGGAMMIQRDLFLQIGGFDEDYFMLYEDVDLGWRLWVLGYQVKFVPESLVYHRGHASLKVEDYKKKAVYYERNSLATLYKNLDSSNVSILLPMALKEALFRMKALGGIGIPFRYHSDGLSTLNGISDFFNQMPRWKEKRQWIQTHRKQDDSEIFNQFFQDSSRIWAYAQSHYNNIYFPGIHEEIKETFLDAMKNVCFQHYQK